jgi:hypothetical protein
MRPGVFQHLPGSREKSSALFASSIVYPVISVIRWLKTSNFPSVLLIVIPS